MSSSVYHGLQSCLEPRFVEPLVLRLKLAPRKPDSSQLLSPTQKPRLAEPEAKIIPKKIVSAATTTPDPSIGKASINRQNSDPTNGWSFLDSVTDNMKEPVNGGDSDSDSDSVGLLPLTKRSYSMLLGEKFSLEMCTESLGSETGSSDISGGGDIVISPTAQGTESPSRRNFLGAKRLSRSRSFPPPLTSISRSTGLQIRPHREGGRLVLEAVTVSSPPNSFLVERSDGRLRMRLWEDDSDCNAPGAEKEETAEEAEEEDGSRKGNSGNVGGEIGNYEKPGSGRPSSCKEEGGRSDKGLFRLEPFVVAT